MKLSRSLIILIILTNIIFAKNINLNDFELGCNSLNDILRLIYLNENSHEDDDEDFEVSGCSEYLTKGKKARILRIKDISNKSKKYSKALLVKYINTNCDGMAFWIAR